MKKLLKIILLTILFFLILLIIDYVRINIHFFINKGDYEKVFNIYGDNDYYAPQGITYSKKYNIVIQTSYNKYKKASKIFITDFDSKKLIKELMLLKSNGKINNNHVGGITTEEDILWITSDYELNEYNLEKILKTNKKYIRSTSDIEIPNRGDFCLYNNNILWIGNFHIDLFYSEKPILLGYKLDKSVNYNKPDYQKDIPWLVQGMAITDDNMIIYSQSFTPLHLSSISIYDNDKEIKNIKIPPMSEGIFYKDGELFISFESSSNRYFYADPKINNIIKMKIDY